MLVDINLLPKKEKRNPRFFIYLIFLLILALAAGTLFYWQYSLQSDRIRSMDKQILQVREATATVEQNMINTQKSGNSVTELHSIIDWADTFPIDTVFVLNQLTFLLPERGFFDAFSYNEDGSIQLTVQFDTSRQAAYYLSELTKSKLIGTAELVSVTTEEMEREIENVEEETEAFLPRYLAVYTIILDKPAVKEAIKDDEEQAGEKGGASE
ncbi:hypothetical protein ACQKIC_07230 [Peribacillus sp. NPDC046944]|uniref:hypothetical protein n=1 Tax=unclassified Peribacillus TaxID=2675266 RepID=UPI003D0094B0